MRILLLSISYPPVMNSAARLFSELAESLYEQGHQVTVMTTMPERYLAGEGSSRPQDVRLFPSEEVINGVEVVRLPALRLPKNFPAFRALEHLYSAVQYQGGGRRLPPHDVVIVYSPPLPLAIAGIRLARRWGGKAVINVQDLYPQSVVDMGLLKNPLLVHMAKRMERWIYRNASAITVHSEGNRHYVVAHGSDPGKVYVVPNWIDLAKYRPGSRNNPLRSKYEFRDAFVISYAGVMGFAQGVGDILKAAARLEKEIPDFLLVLAGGGVELTKLKQLAKELGLERVKFLPHLGEEEYIELLQASDLCLVTLVKNLKTPVVPGKLQCIMAVERPVVCSVPHTSDARTIVEESGCGLWVEAGEPEVLANAILELYYDPAKRREMGQRGRAYSESHFDRKHCVQQYERLLTELNAV